VEVAGSIATALVKRGESAGAVFSILNPLTGNDLAQARKDWPAVKVVLQEAAIRVRLKYDAVRPKESATVGRGPEFQCIQKPTSASGSARDTVFISYSHKDKKFLDELLTHLKPLVRAERVSIWSDKQIQPGAKWFDEIMLALASTKVAVMLVTRDFLASDFIHEHELGPLLKKAQQGGVRVLWVLVRACAYKETPLKDYQALISPDKPLAEMKAERDSAWVKVCEAIKAALQISAPGK
jgi:hypothetical protein